MYSFNVLLGQKDNYEVRKNCLERGKHGRVLGLTKHRRKKAAPGQKCGTIHSVVEIRLIKDPVLQGADSMRILPGIIQYLVRLQCEHLNKNLFEW